MRFVGFLALLCCAVGACRATGRGGASLGSGSVVSDPPGAAPGAEVARAENLLRGMDVPGARAVLEGAGGIDVRAPERSWLLIDLYAVRGRVRAARLATEALPSCPLADVLRAHAASDPGSRLALVARAFATSASSWAHLEAAGAISDAGTEPRAAIEQARQAAATGPAFVRREALLLAARVALDADEGAEAARFADEAAAVDPADPRAPAWLSRIAARRGRRDEAVLCALTALRLQPKSPRAGRRVADFLREDPGPEVEARVREVAASFGRGPTPSAEVEALLGLVAERAGDGETARRRYRDALARGADPVPVDRRLRVLLAAAGDVKAVVALLRAAVPPEVFADPENGLKGAWEDLFRLATRVPVRTPAPAPGAVEDLADAFVRVGGLEEAAALLEPVPSARARGTRDACLRELRFERALKRAVEDGYRAPAEGRKPPTFPSLLATIRDLAREHLDAESARAFEDPEVGRRSVPMLGDWLDHSVATTSPVVAHFRRYGKYALVGRLERKVPEVVLLSLASLAAGATVRTQGRVFRHDVAIGYDREIRAYVDFQGGALSGAALPDGVWLDADASRRENHALREAVRSDPSLAADLDRAAADPSPPDGIDGVFATDEPQLIGLRLARRYFARVGADPWGSFHVLRAHEYGHVLDLSRHLPVAKGLPATAGLVASEGFAFNRVEARLEGRAQLASVRDARDPDLALVDLVRSLPNEERSPEAHERGYRSVVEAMLRRLWVARADYPAVDETRKLLPQLDRLTPDEIRALAEDVARAGFTVR